MKDEASSAEEYVDNSWIRESKSIHLCITEWMFDGKECVIRINSGGCKR
jgi:hypothetical protein